MNILMLRIINYLFKVYSWLIICHVIFSWIPIAGNRVVEEIRSLVYDLTEPYLSIFKRFIPLVGFGAVGLDLSPIIGLIVLQILQRIVKEILISVLL